MYYIALATDYDGTLATHGKVSAETLAALKRFKESGRKLILVTGRELPDLKECFPEFKLFDKIVAENGALIYTPASEEERVIATPPPPAFIEALKDRGVDRMSVGRAIVATWEPHQNTALDLIREQGLELEIIFNKSAVMILQSGVNKATGLDAALDDLGFSAHNVIGIGDAENDHALLRRCGLGVAVANAIPALKETADLVMRSERGRAVENLIDRVLKKGGEEPLVQKQAVAVGCNDDDTPVELWPTDTVLIAGTSGIGKSTLATALTERFVEKDFQFCVFDPEGDYDGLEHAVVVGDGEAAPTKEQALQLLEQSRTNIVVSTLALGLDERPPFFTDFLPELGRLRSRCARPHWLIVDETHHLMPKRREDTPLVLSVRFPGMIMITVHPDSVSADALKLATAVIALGPEGDKVIKKFCAMTGRDMPAGVKPASDEQVLFWRPDGEDAPRPITPIKPLQSRKRHSRKYAVGTLNEQGSFYFRGPGDKMNLRIQNLMIFVQVAEGIDEETWLHHLRAGDFSTWFKKQLRDDEMAEEARAIERDDSLSPDDTRKGIIEAVRRRYTAPEAAPE
ncbi:HAD-IIB family hydrolase [Tianweitania populi]|uniref:Phosphoglycolate phosphatase n=1 Tax=Tianweitania populi TaxID=1607949 RepID=A0A8J3DPS1_9HYPH|nr:HAD family hydrolase [Tianweitania populi]GHD15292.1 phosphoglycolate phosphatase [Tianweitania populi]